MRNSVFSRVLGQVRDSLKVIFIVDFDDVEFKRISLVLLSARQGLQTLRPSQYLRFVTFILPYTYHFTRLYINDYNLDNTGWSSPKVEGERSWFRAKCPGRQIYVSSIGMVKLVNSVNAGGKIIDGIGTQTHLGVSTLFRSCTG